MREQTNEERRSRGLVIAALRENGALSRAEISRIASLSRSTVSNVVRDLLGAGTVVEPGEDTVARREPGVGRPGRMVSLNPAAGAAIGVTIGHRRLRIALADLAYNVIGEVCEDLPEGHGPSETLDRIELLVGELLSGSGVHEQSVVGVGVGIPAPFEQETERIHPSSFSASWRDTSLREELQGRLGMAVLADNDANLSALAEMVWGAGRGVSEAATVLISDGVGAGLIVGGKLYRGYRGTAGEIGHTTMDEYGQICRCGNRGCLETKATVQAVLELLRPSFGANLTIERVLELAEGGDVACRRAIEDTGHLAGLAISHICNLLNPQRLIVVGELSDAGELLLAPLRSSVRRSALPIAADPEIVTGELGVRATVLGGVALALRESDSYIAAPQSARYGGWSGSGAP